MKCHFPVTFAVKPEEDAVITGWIAVPVMILWGLFFAVVAVLYFMIELFGFEF